MYQYLLKEVQRVYKQQGVDINDKHIEVIVGQMLSKMKINDPGDTGLLPGGQYSKFEIEEANEAADGKGRQACGSGKAAPGYYQGIAGDQFVPVGRILPGDYQSAY